MSNLSSGSSRSTPRRSSHGVPRRCWCGAKITTFTSTTKDNPYRRFYRCVMGLEMKLEDHLFKWVDEALVDEVKTLDANHMKLVEDMKDLKEMMARQFELIGKKLEKSEEKLNVVKGKMKITCVCVALAVIGAVIWLSGKAR